MNKLFQEELKVINVGLSSFADPIIAAGGTVVHLEWRPPAQGEQAISQKLAQLINHPQVESANQTAYSRYLSAQPILQSVGPARTTLPEMGEWMILHSGPPIPWERMCGPMQGAIIGAILYEEWASDKDEAAQLAAS